MADEGWSRREFLQTAGIGHEIVRYDGAHEWTDRLKAQIGEWIDSLS